MRQMVKNAACKQISRAGRRRKNIHESINMSCAINSSQSSPPHSGAVLIAPNLRPRFPLKNRGQPPIFARNPLVDLAHFSIFPVSLGYAATPFPAYTRTPPIDPACWGPAAAMPSPARTTGPKPPMLTRWRGKRPMMHRTGCFLYHRIAVCGMENVPSPSLAVIPGPGKYAYSGHMSFSATCIVSN